MNKQKENHQEAVLPQPEAVIEMPYSEPSDPPEKLITLNLHELVEPLRETLQETWLSKFLLPEYSWIDARRQHWETAVLNVVEQDFPRKVPKSVARLMEKYGDGSGNPLLLELSCWRHTTSIIQPENSWREYSTLALTCWRRLGTSDCRIERQVAAMVAEVRAIEFEPGELRFELSDENAWLELSRRFRKPEGKVVLTSLSLH